MLCISTGEIKTFYLFYLYAFKDFNHIHDKGVLQLSPLTFEFSVWLENNGGINWVSLGVFGETFFQLWSWKLPCIIHALGEWEVYRRKCFFEFFWCWDLYPSGRFVLQVSRLQNTGVKLGHAKMFRALQAIGKFRISRRPWDEHDCEANGGQKQT